MFLAYHYWNKTPQKKDKQTKQCSSSNLKATAMVIKIIRGSKRIKQFEIVQFIPTSQKSETTCQAFIIQFCEKVTSRRKILESLQQLFNTSKDSSLASKRNTQKTYLQVTSQYQWPGQSSGLRSSYPKRKTGQPKQQVLING